MIVEKEDTEFFGERKDTMPVNTGNQLAGHTKSPFLIIQVATGRTETAFTGKGDKFKVATMRTAIEGTAVRRVMTMDHPVDVIHNIFVRADDVLDVLKVVGKNSLEDIFIMHKNILQQKVTKRNPKTPHE